MDSLCTRYGPWALVTGASSGIGRAISAELSARGLKVILTARGQSSLEQVASQLTTSTRIIPLDLAQPDAPAQLFEQTRDLDVGLLVNSAGFGTGGEFIASPLATELEMLDLNCRALLTLTHQYGQRFAAQRRGGIILLSSLVSFQGVAFSAHYAATKAYVQSLGEALAIELKQSNVDVLTVAPGPVTTGFATRAGMRFSNADPAPLVARHIVDALGKKSTLVPGRNAKLLAFGLDIVPRFVRIQIMKQVMRSMT